MCTALRWSLWSTGARTPSHRRRLGTRKYVLLRNSTLVDRIRKHETVLLEFACIKERMGKDVVESKADSFVSKISIAANSLTGLLMVLLFHKLSPCLPCLLCVT